MSSEKVYRDGSAGVAVPICKEERAAMSTLRETLGELQDAAIAGGFSSRWHGKVHDALLAIADRLEPEGKEKAKPYEVERPCACVDCVENRACTACTHFEKHNHEEPCRGCYGTLEKPSFRKQGEPAEPAEPAPAPEPAQDAELEELAKRMWDATKLERGDCSILAHVASEHFAKRIAELERRLGASRQPGGFLALCMHVDKLTAERNAAIARAEKAERELENAEASGDAARKELANHASALRSVRAECDRLRGKVDELSLMRDAIRKAVES